MKQMKGVPIILVLTGFIIILAGMHVASSLLVPFILAVFIAVICSPPLFWLQRKGVPKALAVLLILVAVMTVGLAIVALVGSSINGFVNELPGYEQRLSGMIAAATDWLREKGVRIPEEGVSRAFSPQAAMGLISGLVAGLSNVIANTLMILLTVLFILLEAAEFPKKLRAALKNPERSLKGFDKFSRNANRYVVIKTLIGAATGISISLWLLILGVDFPALWGMLAFLLSYVPSIGSIIAMVPATLLALVQLGPGSALLTVLGFLVVNNVFGNFVEPRLMGKGLGLSPLVVFVSLVFWGWLLGPVGMVLSVPLTSLVKIALESNDNTLGLAIMLGSDT
jgi:AI-2 transport protein TqsA